MQPQSIAFISMTAITFMILASYSMGECHLIGMNVYTLTFLMNLHLEWNQTRLLGIKDQ